MFERKLFNDLLARMKTMQIVAIGGGELKDRETLRIDRFIVELTGKRKPKALFIPTASGDAEGYCNTFDRIYGELLGCRTDHLQLISCAEDRSQAEDKILGSDLIYVGGGNTMRMMKQWRRCGVDYMLMTAGKQGAVLAGLSAGAICWHDFGHSDSRSFAEKNSWSFIRVRGLGLCKGIFCPHLDAERRKKPFAQMILRYGGVGIACDNNAAVWYNNSKAIAKASKRKAAVHVFRRMGSKIMIEKYEDGEEVQIANITLHLTASPLRARVR